MNHYPAPEVTARGWRGVLQRFARWRHFSEWEYGTCNTINGNRPSRRNLITGAVQFVLWPKGHVVTDGYLGIDGTKRDYVYPNDWWHDYNVLWWPNFIPEKSQGAPR